MTVPLDSTLVAQYLTEHPNFFVEHADLLGEIKLASPMMGRTVSLQERQMEVMREKYKTLELRMSNLMRLASENEAIANKFHRWTKVLLEAEDVGSMPHSVVSGLKSAFDVPQVTVRLWNTAPDYADEWFTKGVTEDVRIFANSLLSPYCGSNKDFEAVRWLDDSASVVSTVIIPLRKTGDKQAFGLLVMGSADANRFTSLMATDFLVHMGETSSTALAWLLA
ncbi:MULTISPECIES: DUF484 family protein [Duganella]|uniref:DUF484 family protein n=1 Tax=Duganella zoogloeoides TaxID=75659 RepID=A0ABZ0XWX1_9BURK|nr:MULTISPECIES: DUF484 family protein [Duganella]KQN67459.1 hypothetical protein ASF04_16780 [Duganella sp. Leaf61]MPQ58798.1 DUF484 family protein [Duganella sp. FT27W]WQH04245.1 DUF484 family protein [Duganella zoogloeoides]